MMDLQKLRQGDISYDEHWFVYLSTPDDSGNTLVEEEVAGFVILSQTCDIVRAHTERPYLEVCPLVKIEDEQDYQTIHKGMRPRYAYIPATEAQRLVADLDRITTIDKSLASHWSFHKGCKNAVEQQRFAAAIARKRNRFAFPDELVELLRPMQRRIVKKHSKNSAEGESLRILREIRLAVTPSMEAEEIACFFYFIVADESLITPELEEQCTAWTDLITPSSVYISFDAIVTSYNGISALEYISSIPLDLDYLS